MKNLMICVLLCLPACLAYPLDKTVKEEPNADFVQKYLENYYNLGNDTKQSVRRNDSNAVVKKIQEMQKSPGLKVMKKQDFDVLKGRFRPICADTIAGHYSRFPGSPKWKKSNITYRIVNYIPQLSIEATDSAIEKALKLWEEVTPLTFTRLYDGEADIMMYFIRRDHIEIAYFGGSSIAVAFPPGPGINGDIHFYDDEPWTEDYSGINFLLVAAHEIGHSLGLFHSNDPEALMYMFYKDPTEQYQVHLSQDDVNGIQSIYGPPSSSSDKIAVPKEFISTQSEPLVRCDPELSFDAITTIRGETLFFKDRYFWRKTYMHHIPILYSTSLFWPTLPSKLDAAYEAETMDTVFIFKGNQFWATKGNILEAGYPRSIYTLGFPPNVQKIDAAISDVENGKTYFFVENTYWRFDENSQSMDQGFPRMINEDFPGVEQKIDAAFQKSGFFYFFSGPLQIEFDPNAKMVTKHVRANSILDC
ncbi:PREDICTED: stromelysin-2-like [Elephantulus edwardii]|uniref:stromelysin-2-like n=1 Tax=Elephantulus edwardii TaxID=28737 RepID=UPI0003F095D0|nr:PREDICTED: stromelysin-2-like [Elephantulus edwardii]